MTGLRSRKKRELLFQNLKTGFKPAKMMKKLLQSEGNVFEDIVEVIVYLKMTIYDLEDIVRKVLNETNKSRDDTSEEKSTIIEEKSCLRLIDSTSLSMGAKFYNFQNGSIRLFHHSKGFCLVLGQAF